MNTRRRVTREGLMGAMLVERGDLLTPVRAIPTCSFWDSKMDALVGKQGSCNATDGNSVRLNIAGSPHHYWFPADCFFATEEEAAEFLKSGKTFKEYKASQPSRGSDAEKSLCEIATERLGVSGGDYVKVLAKWPSREGGWDTYWIPAMNDLVGLTLRVKSVSKTGVVVETPEGGECALPGIVLKKVDRPIERIQLTREYTAEVRDKGVQVGCQFITFEKCDELIAAVNRRRGIK